MPQALAHFDRAAIAFPLARRHLTVARLAMLPRATFLLERGDMAAAEATLAAVWPFLAGAGRNPVVLASHLLQAEILAAKGERSAAEQQMARLLAQPLRPAEEAAVHFALWRLAPTEEHSRRALALYRALAARSRNVTYAQRLALLRAAGLEDPPGKAG
jgi:hypothetical protein